MACASHRPVPQPRRDTASGTVEATHFTKEDLEGIRRAAMDWYRTKKPEHWDGLVEDLGRAGIFPEDAAIGLWTCETVWGKLALVRRQPPPAALFWGVYLARNEGKWTVTDGFVGEEFWKPES